jgi:hypothetical protein
MANDLTRAISAVKLQVDEFKFPVISNSLAYKEGLPERTVKGLDNGDKYTTENLETAVGMIKADIPSITQYIDDAKTIGARQKVTVKFFDDFGMERVMKSGVCMNAEEISTGTDGKFTLEFQGSSLD